MHPKCKAYFEKHWSNHVHPYTHLERWILENTADGTVVLEHGCGRNLELLKFLKSKRPGATLFGIDPEQPTEPLENATVFQGHADRLPLQDNSVDLIFSRSVMEHLKKPAEVIKESCRVLKTGGLWGFLTPNRWDYVSIISRVIPNRFHAKIVSFSQDRQEKDTFPTHYRANSFRQIDRLTQSSGFRLRAIRFLGQDPYYFSFNITLYKLVSAYERMIIRHDALRGVRPWLFVVLQKIRSEDIKKELSLKGSLA